MCVCVCVCVCIAYIHILMINKDIRYRLTHPVHGLRRFACCPIPTTLIPTVHLALVLFLQCPYP